MKPRLLIGLFLFLALSVSLHSSDVSAQVLCSWTSAVPNLYVSPTTCNVGIGTTTPGAKLHVTGGGGSAVDLRVSGRIHTGDASGAGGVWLDNGQTMFVGQNGSNVGFWTSGAGWAGFQVTNGGKVGIGTASPASKFHLMQSNTSALPGVRYGDAGIFENNGNSFVQILGHLNGEKSINFARPNNGVHGAIKYDFAGVSGGTGGITFWTGENQYKAAVTNDGRLWASRVLVVGGNTANDFGTGAFLNNNSGDFHYDTLYAEGLSGALFTVRSNGYVGINVAQTAVNNILTVQQGASADPIADGWTVYSSRRWKTNIQTIDGALDIVKQLRGVSFNWKATGQHDIGLVAEEVGQVVPEVVAYEENGIDAKSVDYNRLVAVLIQAVKEQQAQIETQQAQIADMEARLTALEKATSIESASPHLFTASLAEGWPLMVGLLLVGLAFGSRIRLQQQ